MVREVLLPQWGMEMQDAVIVRWLKKEGDSVREGEPLVEVETAKLTTEMESTASGTLAYILAPERTTVPVRAVLAIIVALGEQTPPRPQSVASAPAAAAPRPSLPAEPSLQIVPIARRLAGEHNIDLASIRGTGPAGRITEADVRRAVAERALGAATGQSAADASPAADMAHALPLTGVRRTIADRMLHSLQTMAQVTLTTETDVTELVRLQRELVDHWREHRLRPMEQDLVVKATARALKEHPRLNATIAGDAICLLPEVNIGVAMAVAEGLIVPVVTDADAKSLLEIAQAIRELAGKSREGRLAPTETMSGTFTITSLDAFDVDAFTPIINPPQVAILGVGRVVQKPAVFKAAIVARSFMHLSLTFDHRALDGVPAGTFLRAVKRYLEDPRWMVG